MYMTLHILFSVNNLWSFLFFKLDLVGLDLFASLPLQPLLKFEISGFECRVEIEHRFSTARLLALFKMLQVISFVLPILLGNHVTFRVPAVVRPHLITQTQKRCYKQIDSAGKIESGTACQPHNLKSKTVWFSERDVSRKQPLRECYFAWIKESFFNEIFVRRTGSSWMKRVSP